MAMTRILVVEDDLVQGLLLTERLAKLKYEVTGPVPKGEDALEEIRKRPPDLVLMDIKLAGEMNGIDTAEQIRSDFAIPLVFLTAHSDRGLIELAKVTEPFGYLIKPYGDQQLSVTIEMALYKAEMDRRLRESEGRFRGITENTTDITAVLNKEGLFTYVSPAITGVFGYSSEEVLGRSAEDFVHVEDWPQIKSLMGQAVSQQHETLSIDDFRFRKFDGEWVPLEGRIVSLFDTPGVWGTVFNCRDISERKKTHEQLIQTAKYKAVVDLAAGVAHNFNNLLQIIMGNSDLALVNIKERHFNHIEDFLETITESCRFGAEMVARLNGFARFQRTVEGSEREVFDFSAMVKQAIEMTRCWWKTEPEENGLTIRLDHRLQDGCMVHGNKNELFEVLVNLIKNSVEALLQGGVIDISTAMDGEWVVLTVKDTGVGIARDNLSRLFTPFFSTNAELGRGLGLATARTIVDSHGGDIRLESEEGEGSSFIVRLPLTRCDSQGQ